jgi:predicted  nucleic acid-binding Zn-ribbon protein
MNARALQEKVVTDESRIGKLESDVHRLQTDVTEIKAEVRSLRGAIDLLRTEFLAFKTEVAKDFGAVRASMEEYRTWRRIHKSNFT